MGIQLNLYENLRKKKTHAYKFLRVVILVRTFGNGPDNLFPIRPLQDSIEKQVIQLFFDWIITGLTIN